MIRNQRIVPSMLALSGICCSLVFADNFTVKVTPGISETKNPPACYYTYKAPTKKEIAKTSIDLWINLNKFTNANLDLGLLENAETSEKINVRTDKILFDVYNPSAMGFLYTKPLANYLRPSPNDSKVSRLLSKNNATIAAKDYLCKLNLMPASTDEMYFEQTNTIRGAASTNPQDIIDFLQVVRFGRKLNDLKVIGSTRIILRIGKEGELVSVIKDWPQLVRNSMNDNVESYGKSQWNQVITTHLKNKYKESAIWSSVNVDNVELVMYDDGVNVVEPALHAKGNRIDKNGGNFAYDWVIPVLKEPKAKYKDKETGTKDNMTPEEIK